LVQILRTLDTESGVGLAGEIGEQVAFDGKIQAEHRIRNYRQVASRQRKQVMFGRNSCISPEKVANV
jgi:hypothetical protein